MAALLALSNSASQRNEEKDNENYHFRSNAGMGVGRRSVSTGSGNEEFGVSNMFGSQPHANFLQQIRKFEVNGKRKKDTLMKRNSVQNVFSSKPLVATAIEHLRFPPLDRHARVGFSVKNMVSKTSCAFLSFGELFDPDFFVFHDFCVFNCLSFFSYYLFRLVIPSVIFKRGILGIGKPLNTCIQEKSAC